MADKLSLYNMTLGHLLEGSLASLSESAERRRVLDSFWVNATNKCLETTFWKFAKRSMSIDASTTIDPAFGFSFAFKVPDDCIRADEISASEGLQPPLLEFRLEAGYWYSNVTPLFISYVSNDPLYGLNLGEWPESFVDFVTLELACKACKRITGSASLMEGPQGLIRQRDKAKRDASGKDAMNDPIKFQPTGSWVLSRRGGRGTRDGGNGSKLIG